MSDVPEDEALIERLARAACDADGRDPDELRPPKNAGYMPVEKYKMAPYWEYYQQEVRRHLAMHRELERARGDMGNPITEQSQREIPEDWRKEVGCHAAQYGVAATLARYPHWTEREIHDAKREYTDQ